MVSQEHRKLVERVELVRKEINERYASATQICASCLVLARTKKLSTTKRSQNLTGRVAFSLVVSRSLMRLVSFA